MGSKSFFYDSVTWCHGENCTPAIRTAPPVGSVTTVRVLLPAQHLLTTPELFDPLLGFSLLLACSQNVSLGLLGAFAGMLQ